MMKYVVIGLLILNIVAFVVYGIDKWKARRDSYRIPERTLLLFAVFGGSVGAFMGMRVFRHKTQKPKFYLGVPIIFLLQVLAVYFFFVK